MPHWTYGTDHVWRDENGRAATPAELTKINSVRSYPVSTPSEAASRMGQLAKASVAPVAAQLATQGGLSLAGLGEVGWIPLAVRAVAAGLTNVATDKFLPQSLGGAPSHNPLVSFGLGAAPELGSSTISSMLARRAANKLSSTGEGLAEAGIKALDPEAISVQRGLLAPMGKQPFTQPLAGPELTNATNQARQPIMQTIKSARQKYGRPIGKAYEMLKGLEPLDESEAQGLSDFATDLQDRLLAPAPVAAKYIRQLRGFAKAQNSGRVENNLIEMPGGEFRTQGAATPTAEALRLQGLSEKAIDKILQRGRMPDLDDLRELRQQVNADLQRAKGGDYYALGAIQDRLDDILMEKLPPELAGLKSQYRGFIKRWGYDKEHQLANLPTPQSVANWTFKEPAAAHDLMTEARTPEQKEGIKDMFLQYVYGDVDAMAPASKQAASVRQKLAPYMQQKHIAEEMMGKSWPSNMRDMVRWGKYASDFRNEFEKDPKFRAQLDHVFRQYFLARHQDPQQAMQLAMRHMMAGLSKDDQTELQQVMTSLPAPSLPKYRTNPMAARAPLYHGAAAIGALATGHVLALPWQATMLAAWMTSNKAAAMGAASRLGFTRQMLQAFGAETASAKGVLFARMIEGLAHGGAQFGSRVLMEDDDAGE